MSAIDKFKVDETAPFFPIGPMAPTGSYGNFNSGLKNEYVLKFKDNETKSVIRTSGLLSNNAKFMIPPVFTVFSVTNNLALEFIINGDANPTLELTRGQTYIFNVSASGHPFWIKTLSSTGTANQYNTGVTNNGVDVGLITFVVPDVGPTPLYYNCQDHLAMKGTIDLLDPP